MKIRASLLTPILAMLTVVALVATGIALGQVRRGDASATLLDSTPVSAVAAAAEAAPVIGAAQFQTEAGALEQPTDQGLPIVQYLPVEPVSVTGGQKPASPPPAAPVTSRGPAETEIDEPSERPAESDDDEKEPQHDEAADSDSHEAEDD